MKTKKSGLFILCLLFASISFEISAQTHLDALIKKCETHKSVDMEVVKNKRKTDKDVEIKTVNIRITNDKKLVSEFLDAFKKDAPNAEQAMFRKNKENNEINYYQCRFPEQTYTIVVKEEGNANVTAGKPVKFHSWQFHSDSLQLNRQKQAMKQHQKRMEQHKERLKQHQERTEQHKERLKQHNERVEQHKERLKQHYERMRQYKLEDLDSMFIKHNTIADSLILKSTIRLNSINWDSITSKFGQDIDSVVNKLDVGWDKILQKYEFE